MLTANFRNVGTYWRCYHLARNLSKYTGTEVMLLCRSTNYNVHTYSMFNGKLRIVELPRSLLHNLGFTLLLETIQKFDVIHVFSTVHWFTGLSAIVSKVVKKLPLVVDWDDWWTRGGILEGNPAEALHRFLEEKIPLMADAVTVVSEALRRRATCLGVSQGKVVKVINGADVESIRPISRYKARDYLGLPKDGRYLVYVGLSRQPMELFTLFSALKIVARRYDKLKLFILSKPLDLKFKIYMKRLSLGGYIIEVGYVSRKLYLLFLAAADVLLLPMDHDVFENARFPIRFGDYVATGRPVIASDVGEVGALLKGYGITVKPRDVDGWATSILTVLDSESIFKELCAKSRRLAEKIDWRKIAKYLYDIIYLNLSRCRDESTRS